MKKTFQIIVFLAIFGISAQFAYSCSCFRIDNEAEIEMTDFIFVGKVVEITEDKSYVPPKVEGATEFQQITIDSRKRYLVKFKVEKKFKGAADDEITLVKYVQDSMCADTSFENEKTYLIYADKNKDSEAPPRPARNPQPAKENQRTVMGL